MADRKQYEMLFQLNAQLGGSYTSTFTKAQQQLTSMQREIQSLSKLQSDITAYQKQQQGIEATEKKLSVLKQQYDNIQKEIAETGTYSSDLENKLLAKQQQIDKTSESLDRQNKKLQEMGDALQEAGVDTSHLTEESARLGTEIDGIKDKQKEAAESAEKFGTSSVGAVDALSSALAAAGIAAALKEITGAYMECINVTGAFEESMSNVDALSGASADELGQLSALAKELGATTKFTAKESADAMGYMAMAGWSAQQMIEGMPGVLQLAAASGEDLATVSDIVTDSMTAFGLATSETSHYADVLAMTATKANTNVSMMGETFKYAAPLAGALGYAVEDVAVATGLMANSGIKASEAGTTLRNIFTRMAKPTKESADAMDKLGISLSDDSGRMYSFMEIMEQMRDSFSGLTEEQKTFYAAELAGQRGMSGLLAVVNAAESDFASLSEAISNSNGAAQRMASIKLDNMNGQLTLLNSAWEAVQITIGEQLTPTLQELYGEGAKILSGVNAYLQKHPEVIKAVTAFIGIMGTAMAGVMAYAAAMKVVKVLDLATIFASPVGPVLAAVAGVAALTAGVIAFVGAANEGVPSVKELTEAARDMQATVDEARSTFDGTAVKAQATADVMDAYIRHLEEIEAATGGNVAKNEEYHNLLTLISRTMPELADGIDLTANSIEGGTAALRDQTEAWKKNTEAQAYQEYMNTLWSSYNDVMVEAAENSIKYTQAEAKLRKAEEDRAEVEQKINELRGEATRKAEALYKETGFLSAESDHLGAEYYQLKERYEELDSEVTRYQKTLDNITEAQKADQEAVAQAKEEIEAAETAIKSLTEATDAATAAEQENTRSAEALEVVIGSVQTRVNLLTEAYGEAYDEALKSVRGQYEIWDTADKVVSTSAGNINKALESQAKYWAEYNTNLQSLAARTTEIDGLSEVIASFADGSNGSVNAIAGMAKASNDDLRKMVENWKEVQKEQEAASGSIAVLKINITQKMDELQQALAEDIENMDMSAEAAAAGEKTIQAFIDAAKGDDVLRQVKEAYDKLGLAAARSLATSAGTSVTLSTNTQGTLTIAGQAAEGTESAKRGYYLVGEEGPELVYFQGGETVLNAQQTAAALQSEPVSAQLSRNGVTGTGTGPVSITFQIEGNPSPETIDQLEAFVNSAEFEERVQRVVANAAEDTERRAY